MVVPLKFYGAAFEIKNFAELSIMEPIRKVRERRSMNKNFPPASPAVLSFERRIGSNNI